MLARRHLFEKSSCRILTVVCCLLLMLMTAVQAAEKQEELLLRLDAKTGAVIAAINMHILSPNG